MKKRTLLLTFILLGSTFFAQQNKIDSLVTALKTAKEDTNKVNTLNVLCKKYWQTGNYELAKKQANDAVTLSQKINFKKGKANAFNFIGLIYAEQGNYPEALKNHFSSLKIKEEIMDKQGVGASYHNIGTIYYYQDNYPEALINYFASLKIKKKIGDKKGISATYNNIGIIYKNQGNYAEALKNYFASLKIKEEACADPVRYTCDKKGVAATYGNIGIIYDYQGNYTEALKNYYFALKIDEEIGNKDGIAISYINLGSINTTLQKFSVAKDYLKNALALSTEIGSKDNIKNCYSELSTLDSAQGDWKAAYENHKLFIIYSDSIDNEDTKEKTIQASMNYEFDKKEALTKAEQDKKDALTATEIKKQQIIRYGVSGILVLVILFTLFLYNRFRLIAKQKNIIELKEKETQHQKHLVDEKQKEIIESITYAKRLQEAILPPQAFIDKNIKDNFILYKPKDIVAGDFYWAESVNNLFFIAAADSTGHGVPGAMVSVVCSNALNRTIKEFKETEPGKILDKTRQLVIETFEKSASEVKDGMDISLLCIDSKNKSIFWSGAHNSLWYINDNVLTEIKADKQPIGKTEYPKPFVTHQIEYKEDTTFYLFTDGFADQFGGPNGKKFMSKNFKEVLLANSHLALSKQKVNLETTFNNWVGDLEQVDDVCVIAVKI